MKQLKLLFLTVFFLTAFSGSSLGQYNAGLSYNNHFKDQASIAQPSLLGSSYSDGYVSMPYVYAYVGNSSFDYGTLTNNLDETNGTVEDLYQRSLDQLGEEEDRHLFSFGMEFQTLFLSYKINMGESEILTFSLGSRDRLSGNVSFSRNLYQLLRRGNKQFEGEKVQLDPFESSMVYMRDYSLGLSREFSFPFMDDWSIRPAIQGRYIRGFASLNLNSTDISLHTKEGGREIKLDMKYNLNTSHPTVPNSDNFPFPWLVQQSPFNASTLGTGYGIDAGVTFNLGQYISLSSAVTDIGRIKFSENVRNYRHDGEHSYDGSTTNPAQFQSGGSITDNAFIEGILAFEEGNEPYTQSLGSKLILEGELNFFERTTSFNDKEYTLSNFYFTFIRGFEDQLNATTRPQFTIGYNHDFYSIVNLGVNYGMGGYNQQMFGAFASFRTGLFRVGAGSNNMIALWDSSKATGADFSVAIAGGF